MTYLFTFLCLAALLLLVIGLLNPPIALFWKKTRATRTQVIVIYSLVIFFSVAGAGLTATPEMLERMKEQAERDAESKKNQPASDRGREMTEEERMQRSLVRSCDTTYGLRYYRYFNNDTGYAFAFASPDFDYEGHLLPREKWTIHTYKQTGPDTYEWDDNRMLQIYRPIRILSDVPNFKRMLEKEVIPVSPLSSNDTFLVDVKDVTLKNVNQCSLAQKINNQFFTTATYIPTTDPDKRPITDDDPARWVDVPAGATIVVVDYSKGMHRFVGRIFDVKGKWVPPLYVKFYETTLVEKK